MKQKTTLLILLLAVLSCTKEKDNLYTPATDVVSDFIGFYDYEIEISHGVMPPNINGYAPPKDFQTKILRSKYDNEITLTNIHGLGHCVYATVSKGRFTIPFQELSLQEESVGYSIIPDFPDKPIAISGSGQLIKVDRTDTEPATWEVYLEYQITHDLTTLWTASGYSFIGSLDGDPNGTCE